MFKKLFEPIKIGSIEISNRIAMAPMVTSYSDRGSVSEQQLAYYAARAKGGVGLIITEHVLASKWAKDNCPLNVMEFDDFTHMEGFSKIVETIHAFGSRVFIQLNPGIGAQGSSLVSGIQPVAPSPVAYSVKPETVPKNIPAEVMIGEMPREMTLAEIEAEQNNFVRAAMFAKSVGFDGVEIHAAHGFLIHEFLSQRFNKRTDQYGGSMENRARFLVEMVRKTKAIFGADMVLGVRLSAHEPDGNTYEDTKLIIQHLQKEAIDYFHLGDGTFEAHNWLLPDSDGTMLELEKRTGFKKDLNVPLITPAIHDPKSAEVAISDGLTDMVSLGRALLADPSWANKVKSGNISAIKKCVRCNIGCYGRLFRGFSVQCVVNPECGLERYNPEYNQWSLIQK